MLFDHIELIDMKPRYEQQDGYKLSAHQGFKLFDDYTDAPYARGKAILEPLLKQAKSVKLSIDSCPQMMPKDAEKKCNVNIFDDATWAMQILSSSSRRERLSLRGCLACLWGVSVLLVSG